MKQSAGRASPDAISLVLRRRATLDHTTAGLGITSSPTMTRDVHRSTAIEAVAAEFVPALRSPLVLRRGPRWVHAEHGAGVHRHGVDQHGV